MGKLSNIIEESHNPEDRGMYFIDKSMDREIKTTLLTKHRIIVSISIIILFSVLLYSLFLILTEPVHTVSSNRIKVSKVKSISFQDFIPITGRVVPDESVIIGAIDGGVVTEVFVEEGELVNIGQPLVSLTNTNLQLEVTGREAQLAEQINNLSLVKLSIEQNKSIHEKTMIDLDYRIQILKTKLIRYEQLHKSGVVTNEEIEQIRLESDYRTRLKKAEEKSLTMESRALNEQISSLQNAVDGLKGNIEIARKSIENLILRATTNGQLTSLDAHVGETKIPGQSIGKIDAVDSFIVTALVDEFYLPRMSSGQGANAEFNGENLKLRVDKIYPEVNDRKFRIDLTFEESILSIRSGQSLAIQLNIGDSKDSIAVNNGQFYDDTDGTWVYLLDKNRKYAVRHEVKLGRRTSKYVEVLGGLLEGDDVIVSTYSMFGEATKLKLNNDNYIEEY